MGIIISYVATVYTEKATFYICSYVHYNYYGIEVL